MFNQETKKILREEWVNKRCSYKLIQGYASKNAGNQKSTHQLRKTGLEEKLVEICEENDIVFLVMFGSFVRGEQKR